VLLHKQNLKKKSYRCNVCAAQVCFTTILDIIKNKNISGFSPNNIIKTLFAVILLNQLIWLIDIPVIRRVKLLM